LQKKLARVSRWTQQLQSTCSSLPFPSRISFFSSLIPRHLIPAMKPKITRLQTRRHPRASSSRGWGLVPSQTPPQPPATPWTTSWARGILIGVGASTSDWALVVYSSGAVLGAKNLHCLDGLPRGLPGETIHHARDKRVMHHLKRAASSFRPLILRPSPFTFFLLRLTVVASPPLLLLRVAAGASGFGVAGVGLLRRGRLYRKVAGSKVADGGGGLWAQSEK
jgi:hypothetical protein